jgi:flagellar hook-associated protein 3 FlgL
MKSSFISSSAIQNAMRMTIRQAQNQMTKSSLEATTGVYADIGLSLGGGAAKSIDFNREIDRVASIKDSNAIVEARMESSQVGLTKMKSAGDDLVKSLTALQGSTTPGNITVTLQAASNALSAMMDTGNSMVSGEYLFAGINTDVQPLTDQTAPASTAIQTNLKAYASGLTNPDGTQKSVDQLSGAEMDTFITNFVKPMFAQDTFSPTSTPAAFPTTPAPTPPLAYVTSPPAWSDWSSASNQNMTSRISNSEVIVSSTNANSDGMRYIAMATVMTSALMTQGLSTDAMAKVSEKAITFTAQATTGIITQASQLGLSQERVSKANDALDAQSDIMKNKLVDLVGVDQYEASTLVKTLETQLETAYTIVSKIQQLSLVNYL